MVEHQDDETAANKLPDQWTLWAHLPHDTNWGLESYKEISTINSIYIHYII